MLAFLTNYNVGKRLAAGFGLLVVLMALLTGVALSNMSSIQGHLVTVVETYNAKTAHLARMYSASAAVSIAVRNLIILDDAEAIAAERAALATAREHYDEARKAMYAFPATADAAALRKRIDAARATSLAVNSRIVDLALAGDDDQARELLVTDGAAAGQAWRGLLDENAKVQDAGSHVAYTLATADYQRARTILIAVSVAALAVAMLLGWLLTRSIVRPLHEATRVARDIARGRLDGVIASTGRDELATLLASMSQMQAGLQRFVGAQAEMARQHDAGDLDHRIVEGDFEGAYGDMAAQVNAVVASHIAVKMKLVALVQDYARGDLSRDMDRLPGKKAALTEAMDATKTNLVAISEEIQRLSAAAAAGDFSQRGDTGRFQFVYRDMIGSLNQLMSSADTGLGEIGGLLSAVAEGDLSRRIDAGLAGRFAEVATDANRTVDRLADIVGQIRQGSDAINSAASEIAAGNDDLSRRTEQQAASLEETASSMEELTSTVRQNADNARQANQLAIGAVDVASQGGAVVDKVVETMSAISESSNRIADIIGVIDGIAFQTNILALNAAVEAARAGEQGRGFAVVAAEVRSLAQRSAGAAKEIKQLITDSSDKVRVGNQLVDQAGKTMGEIVTSVKRVTDIIADISAASQEQSAGIEQVNQAITQMDESTQQNAALVEEATAAARSMEQQAGQLVQTVAAFRVQEAQAARPAAVAVAVGPATVVAMAARRPARAAATKPTAHKGRSHGTAALAAHDASGDWQEF